MEELNNTQVVRLVPDVFAKDLEHCRLQEETVIDGSHSHTILEQTKSNDVCSQIKCMHAISR